MYKLIAINIYPIKSMGGISLQKCLAEREGLQYDRRWMLVDEKGQFMTQRKYPQMALFQPFLTKNGVEVSSKDGDRMLINWEANGAEIDVKIWDDVCKGKEVCTEISIWLSEKIGQKCRLVFMNNHDRFTNSDFAKHGEKVSFADGFPYLIIGEESLKYLNTRLEHPVSMDRFRPNLVFSSGVAFDEDTWRDFSVGEVRFYCTKPCSRCIITTINQQTAEIVTNEPLKTLSTFRKKGSKINFGQNVCALGEGLIKVGDEVIVSSWQKVK